MRDIGTYLAVHIESRMGLTAENFQLEKTIYCSDSPGQSSENSHDISGFHGRRYRCLVIPQLTRDLDFMIGLRFDEIA